MPRETEHIEIQAPPIEDIKKKSCARRGCRSGCGCILILLILLVGLIKFSLNPSARELRSVPANFPTTIPIYDPDSIERVKVISGEQRGKVLEIVSYVPKPILSPIVRVLDLNIPRAGVIPGTTSEMNWQDFYEFMKSPSTDHRDIITIEWTNLPADPEFIADFYKKELQKNRFTIQSESGTNNYKQIIFQERTTEGVLTIENNAATRETDYASLTIYTPQTTR